MEKQKSIIKKYKALIKRLNALRYERNILLTNNKILRHNIFTIKESINEYINARYKKGKDIKENDSVHIDYEDVADYKKSLNKNLSDIKENKYKIKYIKDKLSKLGNK